MKIQKVICKIGKGINCSWYNLTDKDYIYFELKECDIA